MAVEGKSGGNNQEGKKKEKTVKNAVDPKSISLIVDTDPALLIKPDTQKVCREGGGGWGDLNKILYI